MYKLKLNSKIYISTKIFNALLSFSPSNFHFHLINLYFLMSEEKQSQKQLKTYISYTRVLI